MVVYRHLVTMSHLTSKLRHDRGVLEQNNELSLAVVFGVGGSSFYEKSDSRRLLHQNLIIELKTRTTVRKTWQVHPDSGRLRREGFQIKHGELELLVFITRNVHLKRKELGLLLQKTTRREIMPCVMSLGTMRFGRIAVGTREK